MHAAADEDGVERDEEAADEAREATGGEAGQVLGAALEDADLRNGVDDEARGYAEAGEEDGRRLRLSEPDVGEDDAAVRPQSSPVDSGGGRGGGLRPAQNVLRFGSLLE